MPDGVSFRTANVGYALGTVPCRASSRCPAFVRTRDAGRTWRQLKAPPTRLRGIRFADVLDGWAFGPELYATHDGGSSWSRVPTAHSVRALEVAGSTAWRMDATGASTADAGRDEWLLRGPLGDQLVATATHVYVVAGRVLNTSDRSSTFRPRRLPCAGPVSPAGADGLVLVCTASGRVSLYRSANAGASWSAAKTTPATVGLAVAAQGESVFVVTPRSLLVTTDDGAGWTEAFTSPVSVVTVGGASTVAALTGATLMISRASGAHWEPVRF
jgi:photosystem II stability/assembly factor-like uncharacterized protein